MGETNDGNPQVGKNKAQMGADPKHTGNQALPDPVLGIGSGVQQRLQSRPGNRNPNPNARSVSRSKKAVQQEDEASNYNGFKIFAFVIVVLFVGIMPYAVTHWHTSSVLIPYGGLLGIFMLLSFIL